MCNINFVRQSCDFDLLLNSVDRRNEPFSYDIPTKFIMFLVRFNSSNPMLLLNLNTITHNYKGKTLRVHVVLNYKKN